MKYLALLAVLFPVWEGGQVALPYPELEQTYAQILYPLSDRISVYAVLEYDPERNIAERRFGLRMQIAGEQRKR